MTRGIDSSLTMRMLHLRRIPIATMVQTPVLVELAQAMREKTFHDGRQVLHQGEPMAAMYFLIEGRLVLTKDGEGGTRAPFGELEPPQTVGFLPILARRTTPYHAMASGEVQTFALATDTLLDIMADHFELTSATVRYFAERLWFEFQDLPGAALGMAAVPVGPVPRGRIGLASRILMLQKTSGFSTASINALAVIARQLDEARVPAGTVLWEEGDRADRVFFLIEGTISCAASAGRVFRYGTGTGVGGIEALAGRPRWYQATAATDLVGFWGHTADLLDLFEHDLRLVMDFTAMLARAQLGILEKKAALGEKPLTTARSVTKLGSIRYGA